MVVLRPDAPHGNDRANRGMYDGQLRYQLIAPYTICSTANVLRSHFLCSPIDGCVCVRRAARYPVDNVCHCGFLSSSCVDCQLAASPAFLLPYICRGDAREAS